MFYAIKKYPHILFKAFTHQQRNLTLPQVGFSIPYENKPQDFYKAFSFKIYNMKSLLIAGFLLLGSIAVYAQVTDTEKKDIINFYNDGTKNLADQVSGLSEAQLNWKPNDSTWSIADCIEHIALSEKNIFDWAMGTLKTPEDATKKSEKTDEEVKAMVESREKRVKTFDALQPKKQFGNAAQTLALFNQRRADNIKYIETTNDNLRKHFTKTPLGELDVYQVLLFLNAHTIRHTAQITELKAMADFPKG